RAGARSRPPGHPPRRATPSKATAGLWPVMPAQVADQLRPMLPALVEEMISEIQASVAEYARPGDGPYARAVRRGAEGAASQFVDRIADPDAPCDQAAAVFRRLAPPAPRPRPPPQA